VGFNPYRKFRAKPVDYALIAVVFAAAGAMVVWAFFG
jgi:energy-coupling factor transporter transmembrane protein EcfT